MFRKQHFKIDENCKKTIHEKLEPSEFQSTCSQRSNALLKNFSPRILVRGCGPRCPAHPRPHWPQGAAGSSHHGRGQLLGAATSGLGSCRPCVPTLLGNLACNKINSSVRIIYGLKFFKRGMCKTFSSRIHHPFVALITWKNIYDFLWTTVL